MSLSERLNADFLAAAKARDEFSVTNLRMLKAALKNAQIEKMAELTEADVEKVLVGEGKKLRDALTLYKDGGRADLIAQTERELGFIEAYLPKALTDDELRALVDEQKAKLGVQTAADFGKLMGAVMQAAGSRADGTRVKTMVQEALK